MMRWLRKLIERFRKRRTRMVGVFAFVCRNPDGSIAWREDVVENGDTTPGLNDMLSVYFNSGTQKTSWYVGLIDNSGFSALAASDTISSHAGWSEVTAYDETTRVQWVPNAPSAGVMGGASMSFTMNATKTIKGAFVVSNSTKGGSTGTLFSTGAFDSTQAMTSGQVLSCTYQKTLTAS